MRCQQVLSYVLHSIKVGGKGMGNNKTEQLHSEKKTLAKVIITIALNKPQFEIGEAIHHSARTTVQCFVSILFFGRSCLSPSSTVLTVMDFLLFLVAASVSGDNPDVMVALEHSLIKVRQYACSLGTNNYIRPPPYTYPPPPTIFPGWLPLYGSCQVLYIL